ncbi:hypothetical protein niasHS_006167 [Heterodera schachtii]|uniref:Uncharacterized protein n=1 Tax=Heterodera schachtii TaxID=97005 RepID=A0ABD2JW86_HETSC
MASCAVLLLPLATGQITFIHLFGFILLFLLLLPLFGRPMLLMWLSFFCCANSPPGAPPLPATIVASTTPSVPEGMPLATTATATALNGANAAENGVENAAAAPATTFDLAKLNIAELIPELRTALRPHFSSVHCDLSACPSLNQAPFNLPVQGLGQLICIVPDTVSSEEAAKQFGGAAVLGTCNGFHIVTDGKSPHQVLRLMLSGPTTARSGASAGTPDWRQPIRQFFNARLGDDSWALVSACRGAIGLLKTESASESSKSVAAAGGEQQQKNVMVWLAPISRRITVAAGKKTVKKKVVRKVVRKSSNKSDSPEKNGSPAPEEAPPQSPTVTTTNGTMPTVGAKTTVGNNNQSGTGAKSVSAIIAGRMASLFNNCAGNGVEGAANGENGIGADRNDAAPATTGDGEGETVREISVARFGDDEPTAQSDGKAADGSAKRDEAAGNNAKREEAAGNNAKREEAAGNKAKREESSDTASKQSNGPIVAVSGTSAAVEPRSASETVLKSGTAVEIKPAKADQLKSEPKTVFDQPPVGSRRVGAMSSRTSAEAPNESVPEHSSAIKERRSQSLDGHELVNGTANGVVGTLRMTESSSEDNGRASFPARRPSGATFGQTRAGSSPSSPTGGSESPCSFLSATSGTTSETLINTTSRRFRREDAPSPSLNLVTAAAATSGTAPQQQQQLASSATTTTPRRSSASLANGTSAAGLVGTTNCCGGVVGGSGRLIMNGGYQHQLNVLSPISSCGSVSEETERDFRSARDEITSTTITNAAGDEEEEEEDQTLMLLSHRRRSGSAERSLTGIEMDEVSMRDDFSMMSTVSSQAPQRPTRTLTTIAGSGTMSASIPGAAGRFHSSTVSATRMDEAPISSGTRGFSSSSRWSGRRRSSPSPSQKGSRTALDGLAASSAAQSPQFVSGMVSWRMPVTVLLQTLGLLSYKELSDLRRVHPHWDELCGQLLNQGYYQLIGRAQWLLTESQRKLNREPRLAQPIQLLTRLHVHDIVISCAEQINYDEASDQLDQLQDLARRANIHYRQVIEPEAEKRMSEMYRLSAQQRLQRLDSFLVESSMSRVERESEKARNDMRWELEQLKDQNAQLKKENRELKHLCVRLDGRVDVLERKFKTMARLLQ